jgi:ribosomal protein L19E
MKGRMTPPQVTHRMDRNINPYGERPIDYGHVNDLLKEKYGNERGEAAYQKMVDKPRGGVFFVAGQKIINEKGAMMQALRKSGRTDEHDYQGLYKEWKALPAAVQSKVNAYHSPYKGMSASSMARATETHRSKTTGFHKYGLGSLKG